MRGLLVRDTYGPLYGVDQFCEHSSTDELRVGDTVTLDVEDGVLTFTVALIETYVDPTGDHDGVMGVGLRGADADQVMPGDTLRKISGQSDQSSDSTLLRVAVDDSREIEVHRQLNAA